MTLLSPKWSVAQTSSGSSSRGSIVVVVVFSRWLLVLFARDFHHVNDVIRLWDGLFADGVDLDLVDYTFIAVLLFLKDDRMYLATVFFYRLFDLTLYTSFRVHCS